jgi:hypothetical protein
MGATARQPRTSGRMNRDRSLLRRLATSDRVTHVQVAIDGDWENASRAFVTDPQASEHHLGSQLRTNGECAIEVFGRDRRGQISFCGVRFPMITRANAQHLLDEVWSVAREPDARLGTIVNWWSAQLGAPVFDSGCSAAEVGVIDAWRTREVVRVFPLDGGLRSDARDVLLAAAHRIAAPPHSVIAAEFANDVPLPHWVAREIARRSNDGRVTPSGTVRQVATCLERLHHA